MSDARRAIVVTGSRKWAYRDPVLDMLLETRPDLVIHGGCPTGADSMVAGLARAHGIAVLEMPAQWSEHGRRAGPMRNIQMANLAKAIRACGWHVTCEAFPLPESTGTIDCMERMYAGDFDVTKWPKP